MSGRNWAEWVVLTAAVVTSIAVIWTKAVRPFVRETADFVKKMNTLDEIAQEFRPNHGTSLRDQIDELVALNEQTVAEARLLREELERRDEGLDP